MSLSVSHTTHATSGFPRVSGDEPRIATVVRGWYRFSPRERG